MQGRRFGRQSLPSLRLFTTLSHLSGSGVSSCVYLRLRKEANSSRISLRAFSFYCEGLWSLFPAASLLEWPKQGPENQPKTDDPALNLYVSFVCPHLCASFCSLGFVSPLSQRSARLCWRMSCARRRAQSFLQTLMITWGMCVCAHIIYIYIYTYLYISEIKFKGILIRKSVSVSFRVRVVRASERARRSCEGV